MKFCYLLLAFASFAFADPAVNACGKLEKHDCVINIALEGCRLCNRAFQTAALFQSLLRLLLIVPEIRLGDLCFKASQFGAFPFRVKETS